MGTTSFGKNLRKAREAAGLSQAALGEKMNLKASVIGRYELGEATPKPERILDFAYILGCDVNFLLGYEKDVALRTEFSEFVPHSYIIRPDDDYIYLHGRKDDGTNEPFYKYKLTKEEFEKLIKECEKNESVVNADKLINWAKETRSKLFFNLMELKLIRMDFDEINPIIAEDDGNDTINKK